MPNLVDLTGRRFGRLIVLSRAQNDARKRVRWICVCDCGNTKVARALDLVDSKTRSCGCLRLEIHTARLKTHGHANTRIYRIWVGMHKRCRNPANKNFLSYGGRGISVDPRWDDFAAFLIDMGPPPSRKHSLDRIDNDGPYSPENCRWATPKEQSRNSRRPRFIELNGERKNLTEWASQIGIGPGTLWRRLKDGWPIELALTTGPTHWANSPMNRWPATAFRAKPR